MLTEYMTHRVTLYSLAEQAERGI